jgi:hypothetical protein
MRNALKQLTKLVPQDQGKVDTAAQAAGISEIVTEYLSSRFGIAAVGLTMEELSQALQDRDLEDTITGELTSLLERLDGYRFGGGDRDPAVAEQLREKARSIIEALDKASRGGKKK